MKTTLNLTKPEWKSLKVVHLCHPIFPNQDGLLDVDDVGEFREFLVGILKGRPKHKDSLLYSILFKLDKAVVQNDCDNCDSSGYIPEDKEGGNKECPECSDEVVHNNEPKFLKVAYYEGSLRQDIVIDIDNFPTYLEKQKNREIHIVGVSLHSGDVYISEIKEDEPFKCDACDGSGSIQDGGGEGVYGSCDACDGDGFAK